MVGWWVGAAINLVGSVMINLGTNVMKLGHNKRAMLDLPEDQKPPVTRFREWQIGTAVFIIGNVANFVSFGYAAQSLLAALGSVQFVSNVFFASFVLKEQITIYVVVATACIIGGCLLLVIFGNHSSDDYTVEQLLALYRYPAYIVYLVMMFVFVLGSYILYLHGKHVADKGRHTSFYVTILPVSYSIFSALLGTQSVLFSKSLSVLLRTTVSGNSQLGNWYTWVTLFCFLITAGFWVTRLNKGLRMFPAMIIVPLMQICWTLFSIISGMLYFQEYTSFNPSTAKHGPLNAIMFTVGVLIVFAGVYLLTKSGKPKDNYEELDKSAEGGMELVDNPAFSPDDDHDSKQLQPTRSPPSHVVATDGDVPQTSKITLDTLKFTSLAASTPYKAQRKLGLNATFNSRSPAPMNDTGTGADGAHEGGDTPTQRHSEDKDMTGASSMMGTIRKNAKKLQQRLKTDFNVDPEDFKSMLGISASGFMPNMAMLATQTDMTASKQKQRDHHKHNTSINNNLPSSRFYPGVPKGRSEADAQETRSEDLDRDSEPLVGNHMASDMLRNGSLPSSFTRQGAGHHALGLRQAGSFTTGQGADGSPDGGLIRDIMSKTIRQVEDLSSKAVASVESSIQRYKDQRAKQYEVLMETTPSAALEAMEEGSSKGGPSADTQQPSETLTGRQSGPGAPAPKASADLNASLVKHQPAAPDEF